MRRLIIYCNAILIFFNIFNSISLYGQNVTADFSIPEDLPLVKKFDWMNSRYLDPNRYASTQALNHLKACGTKSLRIEVGWGVGGSYTNHIGGSSGNLTYNFTPMDKVATEMRSRGMGLYWSYAYNPPPLQAGSNPYGNPNNLGQWKAILKTMSSHWKNNGMRADFQGVWNEPDFNPNFYTGDLSTFKPLYENGTKGLREGDPDAVVGGVDFAASAGDKWLNEFLDYVISTNTPMDYLSFHSLGADQETRLAPKRTAIKARTYFNQTELVVGELNPYSTTTYHGQTSSACSDWPSAAAAFDVMNYYLKMPEVTRTFWAQGIAASDGDALAAITYSGSYRRPVYWAHYLYNLMPVDRVKVTASTVKSFASTDGHVAAIMIWVPKGTGQQNVTATFNNVPFASGKLDVWRVDATHNSYHNTGHDYDAPTTTTVSNTSAFKWTGLIPDGGTVLLKMYDNTNVSELTPYAMGTLIRQHHLFYNRGDKSYGVFDPLTWICRLGMSNNDYALVEEGALYRNLPESVHVKVETSGNPHSMDINSALSINLDYRVNGIYTKSVMIHGGLYDSNRKTGHPFGKTGLPDQVVQVSFPEFKIDFSNYAPAGWKTGDDILISFTMQNTGANSRAKFTLRMAELASVVSLNQKTDIDMYSLYPNPAKEFIYITPNDPKNNNINEFDISKISITDLQGRMVHTEIVHTTEDNQEAGAQQTTLKINTSGLQPGVYLLQIRSGRDVIVRKFIKE